jgi:hypothetical protein
MFFNSANKSEHFVHVRRRQLSARTSARTFCIMGLGLSLRTSPAGNIALTTGILSGTEQESLLQTETHKVKTLKTLRQNNAVLRRAALSGQKRLTFLESTTCYCSFIPTT